MAHSTSPDISAKVRKKRKNHRWKFHYNKKQKSLDKNMLSFSLELSSNRKDFSKEYSDDSENEGNLYVDTNCDEMPKVLDDMEEEIQRQLEEKAQKTNLTVANVKNMLKAVITNRGVMDMVNYSLQKSSDKPSFEPKLTRSKRKELMEKEFCPSVDVLQIPLVQKKSEFVALIGQDLPEDSSDEEYNPQEDLSEEESKSLAEESFQSEDMVPTLKEGVSVSKEGTSLETCQENIGQRTRSKFSLSETPLETIEQAFIPPDITTDMYNTDCDNQDWINFLKDFMQPLDTNLNETVDDENDPEYNVMVDEEHESPDIEELRVDRAVKITKKELNDLMSELFEFTNNMADESDEEDSSKVLKTSLDAAQPLENPVALPTTEHNSLSPARSDEILVGADCSEMQLSIQTENCCPVSEPKNFKVDFNHKTTFQQEDFRIYGHTIYFTKRQYSLFQQQFRQHIQLLIQSFLLSHGNPFLKQDYSDTFKELLTSLTYFGGSANSAFNVANFPHALQLMRDWEALVRDPDKSLEIERFLENEFSEIKNLKRENQCPKLPELLMEICSSSQVFIYPLLLPACGFRQDNGKILSYFCSSELQLLAMGLEEFMEFLKEESKDCSISSLANLISSFLMPARKPRAIIKQIKRLRGGSSNPVKFFFENEKSPEIYHYIIPFKCDQLQDLSESPLKLMPSNWIEFFKKNRRKEGHFQM